MNPFVLKVLSLSLISSSISGAAYYIYSSNKPANVEELLKWNGHSVASNDNTWKAIFLEHKKDENLWKFINSENKSLSTKESYPKLKAKCLQLFKSKSINEKNNDYLNSKKYCLDDVKKIRSVLVKNGKENFEEEINEEEKYKVLYVVNKNNPEFSKLINIGGNLNTSEEYKNLKQWCETELSKEIQNIDNSRLSLTIDFCSPKTYKTVKETIKNQNPNWEIANEKTEKGIWKRLFSRWKYTPEILKSINKGNNLQNGKQLTEATGGHDGEDKMKKWCVEGLEKNLWDENIYGTENSLFLQLMSACSGNQK